MKINDKGSLTETDIALTLLGLDFTLNDNQKLIKIDLGKNSPYFFDDDKKIKLQYLHVYDEILFLMIFLDVFLRSNKMELEKLIKLVNESGVSSAFLVAAKDGGLMSTSFGDQSATLALVAKVLLAYAIHNSNDEKDAAEYMRKLFDKGFENLERKHRGYACDDFINKIFSEKKTSPNLRVVQ